MNKFCINKAKLALEELPFGKFSGLPFGKISADNQKIPWRSSLVVGRLYYKVKSHKNGGICQVLRLHYMTEYRYKCEIRQGF